MSPCWAFFVSKIYSQNRKIQERALRFLYNDNNSTYEELLVKSDKCYMHVAHLRNLCIELYKTMEKLNPTFMQDLFHFKSSSRSTRSQRNPYDLHHHRPNQVNFGTNSLRSLAPKVWNSLPNDRTSAVNIIVFKRLTKQWNRVTCSCNACR